MNITILIGDPYLRYLLSSVYTLPIYATYYLLYIRYAIYPTNSRSTLQLPRSPSIGVTIFTSPS
jgi:hypothetical protein